MKSKLEIVMIVAVCAIGTSLIRRQSTPSAAAPSPSPSPTTVASPAALALNESRTVILEPEQSVTLERRGGSPFFLKARIDFVKTAGAAYLLEVKADGEQVGPLLNKVPDFSYTDGRRFKYRNPEGIWNVFYSPDFFANQNERGGGYQVQLQSHKDEQSYCYRYGWRLPDRPDGKMIKIQLHHVGKHERSIVDCNLILELE